MKDTTYKKPFLSEFLDYEEEKCTTRTYPYHPKMFLKYDIFPLFILDGGAFFFTRDHLGGTSGEDFLNALCEGWIFDFWKGQDGEILWDREFNERQSRNGEINFFSLKPNCEKHVWLNRLYFLLPIAQNYFRTRDETWAREWYKYFLDWTDKHPYPDTKMDNSKYCWKDMQVAWRLQVYLHSIFILADSKYLSKDMWSKIYEQLLLHAKHIYMEARKELNQGTGKGNHFLQKGTMLIYSGVLFPEFKEAEDFIKTGKEVLFHQMTNETRNDGSNIEASPSYSHFIARLYLDAFLLLNNNGLSMKGLKECVIKQYNFLNQTSTPSGLTLQISDSYAMDTETDLNIVKELLPFEIKNKKPQSIHFKDAALTILRKGNIEIYVDSTSPELFHHHFGAPHILVYIDKKPLLIDSGCCDYDQLMRINWMKSSMAHNSIAISDTRDFSNTPDTYKKAKVKVESHSATHLRVINTLSAGPVQYQWMRNINIKTTGFEIIDEIISRAHIFISQNFHFPQLNIVISPDGNQAAIQFYNKSILLRRMFESCSGTFRLDYHPGMNENNTIIPVSQISSTAEGRNIRGKVEFLIQ